jgi:cytochrome c-type biogenesis protein CcmE
MKAKGRRMILMGAALLMLGGAAALAMVALGAKKQYFRSPHELRAAPIATGTAFRLGGLVKVGSLQRGADGVTIDFVVTDFQATVPVRYRGLTPDLFREGQGVIAQGRLDTAGIFMADSLLAKHDENYMPPEVAKALKKSGQWKAYGTAPYDEEPKK